MATIKENINEWKNYNWSELGEEWSEPWGNSTFQWCLRIFPMIAGYLPVKTILEIAPGCGRWTYFLKEYCEQIHLVDLNQGCIDICKKRFKDNENISYYVNDGLSLNMIPNDSIDFVFSFDSLVHCDLDVIDSYISQIKLKLKNKSFGLLHHSNYKIYKFLDDQPLGQSHGRSTTVDADEFLNCCDKYGLQCPAQELVNWGTPSHILSDCFSIIYKGQNKFKFNRLLNGKFDEQARISKQMCDLYTIC